MFPPEEKCPEWANRADEWWATRFGHVSLSGPEAQILPKHLTTYCRSATSLLSPTPRGPDASVGQDSASYPLSSHLLPTSSALRSILSCSPVLSSSAFFPLASNLGLVSYMVKMCRGYACFLLCFFPVPLQPWQERREARAPEGRRQGMEEEKLTS